MLNSYPFSPREFERLATYRAAVQAGFFTDRIDGQRGLVAMPVIEVAQVPVARVYDEPWAFQPYSLDA